MPISSLERYSRQVLFAGIGAEGQQRLAHSRVVLVGCGATGSATAGMLARAGVGFLRLIDRDYVEPSNLQRQVLFEEADAAESLPKAIAASRKIRAFNADIQSNPTSPISAPATRKRCSPQQTSSWTAPTISKPGTWSMISRSRTPFPGSTPQP